MKSYAEGIKQAHNVITRALQAMGEGQVDGCLCYISMENALVISKALWVENRRLQKENTPEG